MKLRVQIGSNAQDLQTAWVNCEDKPTEVENDYWIGRVFVRVRDFDGLTPDGSPPQSHSPYFEGRNRKFHIQAEGRFKRPYNGDQVWFGTQFDHMIDNFPETLFNTGMRIAKYIDPATFYDKSSAKPYIMSPYLACVNTLSAWPAPSRAHDAVLTLENGEAPTASDDEQNEDDVPVAEVQHSKKTATTKPIRYWSFAGFREDETSNTLTRKVSRSSQLSQGRIAGTESGHERQRSGSVTTTVSARYDPEAAVTSEHPSHGRALRRLGSYSRLGQQEQEAQSGNAFQSGNLTTFPEDMTEDEDDDMSFHTAFEDQYEEVVEPDGTKVVKKKKGLSVKKVRKSLHIPSAKTIERNMRSLSIKRKDKSKGQKAAHTPTSVTSEEASRKSGEETRGSRKSLDLMRPFRSHKHDKETMSPVPSQQAPSAARHSIALDHDIAARQRSAVGVVPPSTTIGLPLPPLQTTELPSGATRAPHSAGPALGSGAVPSKRATLGALPEHETNSKPTNDIASLDQQSRSMSINTTTSGSTVTGSEDKVSSRLAKQRSDLSLQQTAEASQTSDHGTRFPSKSAGLSTIRADALAEPDAAKIASISHRFDQQLGPWRFSNPAIEPIEDTAFIDGGALATVKERRKHFAKSVENREDFEFDVDIVYCMSFFLPYMNFNTFDVKLGPLSANLRKYVPDQPIRYMARCSNDPAEVFFMINFELVEE